MTEAQEATLRKLCDRYNVEFNADHYHQTFDLPPQWVAGWIGGPDHGMHSAHRTLYVGVNPEGEASS